MNCSGFEEGLKADLLAPSPSRLDKERQSTSQGCRRVDAVLLSSIQWLCSPPPLWVALLFTSATS